MTLPKDGNNQTFPEGILKFRNINAEEHPETGLFGVTLLASVTEILEQCLLLAEYCIQICIGYS